jgi:hypothetical protein
MLPLSPSAYDTVVVCKRFGSLSQRHMMKAACKLWYRFLSSTTVDDRIFSLFAKFPAECDM